jgi:hypothetical protein
MCILNLISANGILFYMKCTRYFTHTRHRADRAIIKDEWLQKAIAQPDHTQIQRDGRIRKWIKVPEYNKYLRVILLEDGETIHNAFFDRNFQKKE